ncbi:MAG: nucleotide exchange factor GrpE [Clostridia bacterium]|nr:nucleotide exchange factor GrpE [Clostridia bacterium]MEE1054238.1 nucleotide exchange factor GrpE [Acutalibacteraceae bacterium]
MADENKTTPETETPEVKETAKPEKEKKEKKTKKDAELEKVKAELESKNDLLLRTAAEFDNFKKRTERERAGVAEYAKANVIKELLPILDNIDRAAALEDKTGADYIKGIEMIVKQFEALVGKLGITEVAKAGDTFDPNCHEAVMHIEDETLGENVIAEVLQKGFKIGDTVIRPAMVKVAN